MGGEEILKADRCVGSRGSDHGRIGTEYFEIKKNQGIQEEEKSPAGFFRFTEGSGREESGHKSRSSLVLNKKPNWQSWLRRRPGASE